MAMARAAESSQLLRKRELWMGSESVCLPAAPGWAMSCVSAAILARIGKLRRRHRVVAGGEEGRFAQADDQPAASSLRPILPLFDSARDRACSVSSDLARSAGGRGRRRRGCRAAPGGAQVLGL